MIRHLAWALLLVASLALADLPVDAPAEVPADTPRQQIERAAEGDGVLLCMAAFCRYPIEESKKLLAQMTEETLAQAQQQGIALTKEEYRALFAQGYKSAAELFRLLPSSGENYESNCKEVAEKIAKRMKL